MRIIIITVLTTGALCSSLSLAPAQTVPGPKPFPQIAPTAGIAVAPPTNEAKRSRAVGSPAGTVYRSTASSDTIPPLVIQFSSTNPAVVQEWEEDLSVMTHIIEEGLQRAADEDLADIKMGIRMMVTGNRSVRPLYLEGFGALFMIKVNFPVVPPSRTDEEKAQRTESEWDKAKQEVYSRRQASWMAGNVESGADYDENQVDTLKKELIESLKNASNFRNLKPDEYVSITVFGSPNSGAKVKGTSRRKKSDAGEVLAKEMKDALTKQRAARPGTVLTLRVKKSDADAFAKGKVDLTAFEQKVGANSYLGNGYGIPSLNSWIRSALQEIPFGIAR